MPSTASISRWLTQNSEELITDEAPKLFILICRIETPLHREDTRMAAMRCAELRQGYKKPVRFYTTLVILFTLLRPRALLPEGFVMCDAFQRVKNVDKCTATQKKIYSLARTRCFALLPPNQQLSVTELKTTRAADQTSLQTLFRKRNP